MWNGTENERMQKQKERHTENYKKKGCLELLAFELKTKKGFSCEKIIHDISHHHQSKQNTCLSRTNFPVPNVLLLSGGRGNTGNLTAAQRKI